MNGLEYINIDINLFENRKIKIINTMPAGDTYFSFWIELLCLAGKSNQGGWITLAENRSYTSRELSIVTDIPEATILEALKIFEDLQMIRRFGNRIHIKNWMKYQFPQDIEVEE
jgi:predicted phage replisome organizer